ncbi:MAG: hypothetical protein ACREQ5_17600, partial [Candidatus Dormibacteria bacterium]
MPDKDEAESAATCTCEDDSYLTVPTDAPYIAHLKADGLFDGQFPDEKPAKPKAKNVRTDVRTSVQKRWDTEQRLAEHGLALSQLHGQQDIQHVVRPVLEGSELQGGIQDYQFDPELSGHSWHRRARRLVNSPDLNDHHFVRTREHERLIPLWTRSDAKVRQVLERVFPRMATSARQRAAAGRWLWIVYLFFRALEFTENIATDVGCT